jgi:predicted anti-sigma-YlaC factor YlaD
MQSFSEEQEKESISERKSLIMLKKSSLMLKLPLRYVRYALSALATIGFIVQMQ